MKRGDMISNTATNYFGRRFADINGGENMIAGKNMIDFTQDSIIKRLALFSLPIVMGELLQTLYNSVDALVVGNFVDDAALAAVTVSSLVSAILINFFNGMSVGANVAVSRAFGRGDKEELVHTIRTAFTFSVILGVILSLIGIILAPQLLNMAGTREEYYSEALQYLRIYLAGVMFTVIYNNGAGILRAIGDAGTPFYSLLASCVLNIILDVALVKSFSMGVIGAALATIFSQLLSSVCIYCAINKKICANSLAFSETRTGKAIIEDIVDIGFSAGLQSALISISNIFVMRYINLFNTAAVAGTGVAQRVEKFIILPAKSFGITMTTFVSQNLGAKRYKSIRKGSIRCLLLALAVTELLSLVMLFYPEQIVAIFNSEPDVIRVGADMMRVFTPFVFLMAIRECLLGIFRGFGFARVPMLLTLAGMVGIRQLFLAITMHYNVDIRNIYYCYPLAWFASVLLLVLYFFAVRGRLTGLTREKIV